MNICQVNGHFSEYVQGREFVQTKPCLYIVLMKSSLEHKKQKIDYITEKNAFMYNYVPS